VRKTPLTARGAGLLREELRRLKSEVRPRIIQAISEARALGDLKENAEYHAAKEEQGFTEGRIQEIEGRLASAEIIDVTSLPRTGRVVFGATVDLIDEADGSPVTYQVVGEDEANVAEGRISITSPIARALIGRTEGDVAVVAAPGGERTYEIIKVHYV
jgi:transcription elongation factor GreA